VLSDKAAIAMRSLRPLVKARAFGMTQAETAVEIWMSRMNVWKLREGVILSAGVCQPERRISLRPAVADHRSITTDAVLSDKAAIAMRSLCPLVKARAFGMTQVEIVETSKSG